MSLPDTALVREAQGIVGRALPAPILAHSLRTFRLAEAYARATSRQHDEEGLCLAALFHDLGLALGAPSLPFQVASSRALVHFLEERGVPAERITPLADAIDFHLALLPRWSLGAEVGLLQVGAWMDVYGLRRRRVREEAARIDAEHPRVGFSTAFHRALFASIVRAPLACVGMLAPGPWRYSVGA
ncbi:MAG TPA: HD domain-containing protein [Labilithrix sp.]